MKTLFPLIIAVALLLCVQAAGQTIPQLKEIPANLPDPLRTQMIERRDALIQERSRLKEQIAAHNGKTAAAGTEAQKALLQEGAELRAELARHIAAGDSFNAELEATLAAVAPAAPTTSVPNPDSSVVDLSGAGTHLVDPSRVAGGMPPASEAQPVELKTEWNAQARAVIDAANPSARESAEARLRVGFSRDLRQTALEYGTRHAAMIADMQLLKANGQEYQDALAAARQRIHQKEFSKVLAILEKEVADFEAEIARGEGGGRYDQNRVDAIYEQVQHSEAAVLRDSYEEMAAEVKRLRERLMVETNGRPKLPAGGNGEKAINSETADFVDTVFPPAGTASQ